MTATKTFSGKRNVSLYCNALLTATALRISLLLRLYIPLNIGMVDHDLRMPFLIDWPNATSRYIIGQAKITAEIKYGNKNAPANIQIALTKQFYYRIRCL